MNPSPESSEEDRDATVTVCTGNDAIQERDTLNQAVVRIVNEAARDWRIECLRHEIRDIISLASIKKAMGVQAEANRRKRAQILQSEGDQQSNINLARKQQNWDSVEQQISVQDPGAHAQPK